MTNQGGGVASRAVNTAMNLALNNIDRDKINAAHSWLKDVVSYLLQTLPAVTGMQTNAKLDDMRDALSSMSGILSDYSKDSKAAQIRFQRIQELTLRIDEIKLNKEIGRGGFSTVFLGVFHNKQCAIKVVRRPNGGRLSQVEKEAVENELIMTRFLADPNILHCYGFVHDVDKTLVVLEFAPYGSLWELLCDDLAFPSATSLPFSLSLGWIKDLCSAAGHMYAKGVKHGDIKAENLLVYAYPDRLIAKLCDFGFARQSSGATMSVANGVTANFEAPEVRATGKASFASDVFSIGMTAVQILTRRAPARHEWQSQVQRAVASAAVPCENMRREVFEDASSALQALLLRAVEEEQIRRPNAIEAAKSVLCIFDHLGGDPRTDSSAPEYDKMERIEDRVKQALKQRVEGTHPKASITISKPSVRRL
jgi:serine/threonine protein kinase